MIAMVNTRLTAQDIIELMNAQIKSHCPDGAPVRVASPIGFALTKAKAKTNKVAYDGYLVRNDGWTMGCNKDTVDTAYAMWADRWIAYVELNETGTVLQPLPKMFWPRNPNRPEFKPVLLHETMDRRLMEVCGNQLIVPPSKDAA